MKNFMGRTMAKMNDNRKKGRKALRGFTLVEIIVVLVILAILAAAMIPALTGYIDKAKEKTAITEARNVATALQTLGSENYGLNGDSSSFDPTDEQVKVLSEHTGKMSDPTFSAKGKLLTFTYVNGAITIKYDSSKTGDKRFEVVSGS